MKLPITKDAHNYILSYNLGRERKALAWKESEQYEEICGGKKEQHVKTKQRAREGEKSSWKSITRYINIHQTGKDKSL